ncbi:MAG TPA: glutaredoxin domain-containing protein [Candidatus Pacearchaeota archaeon]|nr:glutaredoxin domain-containing protein [Candidatus Pacearchaeota archaeon]
MTKEVKVYTTPICPYCMTLKKFLKDNNVEFEEIDASASEETQNLIVEKTGKMNVPVIVINDEWMQGFNREKLNDLLDLKQ